MDHAITVRDVLIASGVAFLLIAIAVSFLAYLNALNTDL